MAKQISADFEKLHIRAACFLFDFEILEYIVIK